MSEPTASSRATWQKWFHGPAPALAVALAVLAWLLFVNHSEQVFEFDPDEGNNVIKALLVREGHAYGTDIWTDQPPLFSYLLLPAFALFGTTMDVARGAVSVLSAALVLGGYEALRRSVGHFGALVGAALLLTSALYIPLSVSVMIGLPSVACLVLATHFALEAGRQPGQRIGAWVYAGLAGILSGAAVGIKLFAAPVVPVLLMTVLLPLGQKSAFGHEPVPELNRRTALKQAAIRGLCFGAACSIALLLALAPLLAAGTLSGLVETHQVAREQAGGSADGWSALRRFVSDDPALFLLALQGTLVAFARRRLGILPWLAWLLVAGVALLDHSPVWPHHRLLLTVPAAMLAGHAFFLDVQRPTSPAVRWTIRLLLPAVAVFAIGFAALQNGRLEAMRRPAPWTSSKNDWEVFAEFSRYAASSKFVAAARPTFAFRAGRPVPPNLAVTSWKRFRVGLLTAKRVAKDVGDFRPETVLFSSRWPGSVRAAVEKKIKKTHRRVKRWRHQSTDLWVSKDLLGRLSEKAAAEASTAETNRAEANRAEAAESSDRADDSEP